MEGIRQRALRYRSAEFANFPVPDGHTPLDGASAIELGFPHDVVAKSPNNLLGSKLGLVDPSTDPVR